MNDAGPVTIELVSPSNQPVDLIPFNEFGVRPLIARP
jgi:hypothetical protein